MRRLFTVRLPQLYVQPRIAALIGIVAAVSVLLAVATLTIFNLRSTSSSLDAATSHSAVGEAYTDMILGMSQAQLHSQYLSQTGDPAEKGFIIQAIKSVLDADNRLKAIGSDQDRAFIADLETRYGAELAQGIQVLNGLDPTATLNYGQNAALLNSLTEILTPHANESRDQASTRLSNLRSEYNDRSTQILLALGIGLPIVGLLGISISRYERKDALKAAELKRLSQAALTDGLTGLANHRAFQEDLRREVMRASRTERPLSIAMIDIDDFKEVNDSSGHARGDAVLSELGRLMSLLRAEDRAYRVGGDEFALILSESGQRAAVEAMDRLRESVAAGISGVTISIGLTSTDSGVRHPMMLRDHADTALYEAKHRGKNQVVSYSSEMDRGANLTATKMIAIREVLRSGKVTMWFQPIYKLGSRHLLAFEALLRLPDSPELSGPEEAFEIAQHMGRTLDLDTLCVSSALDTARTLPQGCKIFINLDPATLIHADFSPDLLARLADERGIDRDKVVFELTEKTDAPMRILSKQLEGLRKQGFSVALDDVGSGNSGLEMLRVMKFDYVKIDRSVILDAMNGGPGRAVILAIVAFARETGAFMIAEGIENKAMLDTIQLDEDGLRRFWVQGVQGFLFGKPRKSVEGYVLEEEQEKEKETRAA